MGGWAVCCHDRLESGLEHLNKKLIHVNTSLFEDTEPEVAGDRVQLPKQGQAEKQLTEMLNDTLRSQNGDALL